MNLIDEGHGEVSSRNAGLVRDRDDRQAYPTERMDRIDRPGKAINSAQSIKVSKILERGSVPVEEYGRCRRLAAAVTG
jgi:hypothetical protein